jgi:hypothetical protein
MVGDSGIDTNGNAIRSNRVTDQGIDLKQGEFDYYAVVVPTNNAGVLRTVVAGHQRQSQSLLARRGAAPTSGSLFRWRLL